MNECPVCGSEILYEVTTLEQAEPEFLCGAGHRFFRARFRAHRYSPPLAYMDPRDTVMARWNPEASPLTYYGPLPRRIYCGPPAPFPRVPTPEDLLEGAGLLGRYDF
jgi:hypothetical protein